MPEPSEDAWAMGATPISGLDSYTLRLILLSAKS